jgi:hypothetical protein
MLRTIWSAQAARVSTTGFRSLLAFSSPRLRRQAVDRLPDTVWLGDAIERARGDRRGLSGADITELVSHLRLAVGFGDPGAREQLVDPA